MPLRHPRSGTATTTTTRTTSLGLLDAKAAAAHDDADDSSTHERATRDLATGRREPRVAEGPGADGSHLRRGLRLRTPPRRRPTSDRGGRAERCLTSASPRAATSPTSPPPPGASAITPRRRRWPPATCRGAARPRGPTCGRPGTGRRPGQDRLVRRLGAGGLGALAPARAQGPDRRGGPALAALRLDGGEGDAHEGDRGRRRARLAPDHVPRAGHDGRQERARRRAPLRRGATRRTCRSTARSTPAASSTSTTSPRATGSPPTTGSTRTASSRRTGSPTGGLDRPAGTGARSSFLVDKAFEDGERRARRLRPGDGDFITRPRSSATRPPASCPLLAGASRGARTATWPPPRTTSAGALRGVLRGRSCV